MLRWCVYCQEFLGEVAPVADFSITHGICKPCKAKGSARLDAELDHSLLLQEIQSQLMAAGLSGDIEAARTTIDAAVLSGVRLLDILVGLIAPLLSIIGEGWEQGSVTVAEEHRFTSFCETVFAMVRDKFLGSNGATERPGSQPLLLMNAYGNVHTLGIRILALWLRSKGLEVHLIEPPPAPGELLSLIRSVRPVGVLISLALAEQRAGIMRILEVLNDCSGIVSSIFIGGYAIKMELIDPIPGCKFVTDITTIANLLQQTPNHV